MPFFIGFTLSLLPLLLLQQTAILPLFHHSNSRKNPSRHLVGKVVLSFAYLLFFSVQTCFRYTTGPADVEAVSWAQTKAAQTPSRQIVHSAVKSGAFSYLNKRYEQSSIPYLPLHPGQISPVSFLVAHQYFYRSVNLVSSTHNSAFLRGPPALQS
jgi:hypothetical protein